MRYLRGAFVLALTAATTGPALAQAPADAPPPSDPPAAAGRLTVDGPHPSRQKATAAELRTARARRRAAERRARLEAYRRHGYHPLRPPATTVPFMTSYAAPPRTAVVPIFVPAR